jgi:hypothetical protein
MPTDIQAQTICVSRFASLNRSPGVGIRPANHESTAMQVQQHAAAATCGLAHSVQDRPASVPALREDAARRLAGGG